MASQRIRKVVFPVGGLGTRFLPATKALPKEMLPVVDKPIIHYAFEEAIQSGIEQFIFVTGRNKSAIDNHFDHSYELENTLLTKEKKSELSEVKEWLPDAGQIFFTRQQEALGLGHAVWCARHLIGDEPFAVILPDDMILAQTPCLKQMMEAHAKVGGNMVATMNVSAEQTKSYGVIDPEGEVGKLVSARGVVEKPNPDVAPSTLAIIGRYILEPEIFNVLENQSRGAGGEIQLTDAINTMATKGTATHGLRFDGTRFDCGNKLGFIEANLAFALARDDLSGKVRELLKHYAQHQDA